MAKIVSDDIIETDTLLRVRKNIISLTSKLTNMKYKILKETSPLSGLVYGDDPRKGTHFEIYNITTDT